MSVDFMIKFLQQIWEKEVYRHLFLCKKKKIKEKNTNSMSKTVEATLNI